MRRWVWIVAAAAVGWTAAQAAEAASAKPRTDAYFYDSGWNKGACADDNAEMKALVLADLQCLSEHHGDFKTRSIVGAVEIARQSCKAELASASKRLTGCDPAHAEQLIAAFDFAMRETIVDQAVEAYFLDGHDKPSEQFEGATARLGVYAACVASEAHARRTPGHGKDELVQEAKAVCAEFRDDLMSYAQANLGEGAGPKALVVADQLISDMVDADLKSPPVP